MYRRGKHVYERLRELNVTTVLGFNVPQLLGCDDDLRVLEMTIVKRPFVLDFAGAYLDTRPEFPADVWADWEADLREKFGARWPAVRRVLDAFEEAKGRKGMTIRAKSFSLSAIFVCPSAQTFTQF